MVASPDPSILAQLRALCQAHPTARKVVFVPRVQLGEALETAAARRGGDWAGLSCCLPRHYAEELARWSALASGRREMPPAAMPFLAAGLIEGLDDPALMDGMPAAFHFARTVARSITTLRQNDVAPDQLRQRARRPQASQALQVLAACYDRYHQRLDGEALYDDADIVRWAQASVREAGDVPQTVYAVCDGTDLPDLSYRLLQTLKEKGAAFYRIGDAPPDDAPSHTAAALFREAPRPEAAHSNGEPRTVRTCRAVGAENEVRSVLREILEAGLPLDEVEIACASSRPYLSLTADLAEQVGMEVTLGTGLPAVQTRSGQALCGFYEWIQDDFDAAQLIRLLRSGLVRIDRVLKDDAEAVSAHEAATLLAARRYEPGRTGYAKAFSAAIGELDARIEELDERGVSADRERRERRCLESVQQIVNELIDLVPRRGSTQAMAQASRRFLERFGPVDPPDEDVEEARTLEEAARGVLYQKLGKLTDLPFTYEASGAALASMLREAVERQYVRSAHPRAGAAHVVPLESAGYTGRKHLFVVGMDSDTLSWPGVEDIALRDADRAALGADLQGHMPNSRGAADEALWRITCALRRHRGSLTLCASVFDVAGNEACFPASLFLEVESTAEARPLACFLPAESEQTFIDDRACWLRAYADGRQSRSVPPRTARDALEAEHAWILAGEAARRACCSDRYTCHDGLLAEPQYPELDFTEARHEGPPMSAGRLETLAETPYLYFLKYVLDVKPLDEPALDDRRWLDPLRRGTVVHRTFRQFMGELDGEPVRREHEDKLMEVLDEVLEEEKKRLAPPNERTEAAARRALQETARVFLHAEADAAGSAEPLHHELGFGYGPRRRKEGDHGSVQLSVGSETRLPLCGRIDRVDRLPDGRLAVWDYKTGKATSYSQDDPLSDGAHLQWALYAYVLSELTGDAVGRSGYYFVSTDEMGVRLHADPSAYREAVEEMIGQLATMARHGCFSMTPDARNCNGWSWGGYGRLFPDLAERSRHLKKKDYPQDRPRPLFMSD